MSNCYKEAGVDIDKGNKFIENIKSICSSTSRPGCDASIGGFGGICDLDAAGWGGKDTMLVMTTDGVGTKLEIACAAQMHNTIGIDLVAMCVNDLLASGAVPLAFLNYYATGSLNIDQATSVINGIACGCNEAGCALVGGETAEMPSVYSDNIYDLAGFAIGCAKRGEVLPQSNIVEGDLLIGLPSSGLHSNGFSLVRQIIKRENIQYSDPCPWLTEKSIGEVLLTPTRIYTCILKLLKTNILKAAAHITGGGIIDNLPRVLPDDVKENINTESWEWGEVFDWLSKTGNISKKEMLRTFNCGIGMILVISPDKLEILDNLMKEIKEKYVIIGNIDKKI